MAVTINKRKSDLMRIVKMGVVLASFMLLVGCAAANKATHQPDTKTALDCDLFIDAGSLLALEIAGYENKPNCERRFGNDGRYVDAFGAVGVAKSRETIETKGERSLVLIYRYFNSDESVKPIEGTDVSGIKNFRVVSTSFPIQLLSAEAPGRVTRFEMRSNDVTRVCVSGVARNADSSRTLVEICRPLGVLSNDDTVMKEAVIIADSYFPAVNP